eukprot:3813546-Alexandrium_andersonii.AAC.1
MAESHQCTPPGDASARARHRGIAEVAGCRLAARVRDDEAVCIPEQEAADGQDRACLPADARAVLLQGRRACGSTDGALRSPAHLFGECGAKR